MFDDVPRSYYDARCRSLKNKCRIRFQGSAMWVEGQGGIQINQFLDYRFDEDGGEAWSDLTITTTSHMNQAMERKERLYLSFLISKCKETLFEHLHDGEDKFPSQFLITACRVAKTHRIRKAEIKA